MCWGTGFSQDRKVKAITPYADIAVSSQIWPSSILTIGIQGTAGIVILERFSIGAGYGVGSRNYEYRMIPVEIGYVFLEGNCAVRVYGGSTTGSYLDARGFLGGADILFRPQFENRKLKLVLGAGLAFDKSDGETNYRVDPDKSTLVAGPRVRIGLGI